MEMRKHGQIQETECMEFVGGDMRMTYFLGHEQVQEGISSLMAKGNRKEQALVGTGNSSTSAMFSAYRDNARLFGRSSLENIKVNVTVM